MTTLIWPKTGKVMVQVPAGPFRYGERLETRELPAFWIARTPITNTEYKCFLDANPMYPLPYAAEAWARPYNWDPETRGFPPGKAEHPVGLVDWYDAQAYAEWAGGHVPTEEEWEKAARGDDGRRYPWGPWDVGRCNSLEAGGLATTPVDIYSPAGDSPYGCADMVGNVWEWTTSRNGREWFVRGGSFLSERLFVRVTSRDWDLPNSGIRLYGFRFVVPG